MSEAPFLTKWFEIMDSDTPSRILDLIDDDFTFSILFSTDGRATDFAGGREAMEGYLAQREKGTLTHHPLEVSSAGRAEFYLGEVRRGGEVVANYVAAGQVGASGRLERLIIGRSPAVRFEGGADV
ncbi:nuclear transport factor 2 family protein [Amycolatopsis sp. NPDC021455]|uniref:nuclear transport factor 2 family protein n=1 Tax=Amycolatopsis sp. NPDC021455 TaxID=3154901 RepID=UPI0033F5D8C5